MESSKIITCYSTQRRPGRKREGDDEMDFKNKNNLVSWKSHIRMSVFYVPFLCLCRITLYLVENWTGNSCQGSNSVK